MTPAEHRPISLLEFINSVFRIPSVANEQILRNYSSFDMIFSTLFKHSDEKNMKKILSLNSLDNHTDRGNQTLYEISQTL